MLSALGAALAGAAPAGSAAHGAVAKVLDRCRERVGHLRAPSDAPAAAAPEGAVLREALALMRSEARREVADAFAALAPQLHWAPRAGAADPMNPPMNTMLLGPGGIEERDDLWIGASLMASHTQYPVHRHPPEEVYLSLTPGEWWNEKMDWCDPGEGVIHNPPGIRHSMRAGAQPLLTIWLLPL